MIIYATHITPRLQYIVNFFSGEMSNEPWRITSNADEYCVSEEVKINYSTASFNCNGLQITPHILLFAKDIVPQQIDCAEQNGLKIFFQNSGETGFDIFAASFYLLSRYEEYLPHSKDQYGRYTHENSLAYQENFLQRPLINLWIEVLKKQISQKFPAYQFKKKQFIFLPTYDIDMAWSFRHKGFWRNTGNFLKDVFSLQLSAIYKRYKVLAQKEKDPFDTFGWLHQLHEKYQVKPYYFFLVAEKLSQYDKNISPHTVAMKQLIADHTIRYPVGLHPSYKSNSSLALLQNEKNLLSNITGTKIISSRQHYLKLTLPETYQRLIQAELLYDFTMGYSGSNGFRASVASPFLWYDLPQEKETGLTVFPFCFMEVTSKFYKNDTASQAFEELKTLYRGVKNVNGFFSMLWHNSSFSEEPPYQDWKELYEKFIQYATSPVSD